MDPLIALLVGMLIALLLVVLVAALHPRPGQVIAGSSFGPDAADAEIETVDLDQMIEARNERRRLAGRPEIGDELVRQALGEPPER
jgi:hypothetical protein